MAKPIMYYHCMSGAPCEVDPAGDGDYMLDVAAITSQPIHIYLAAEGTEIYDLEDYATGPIVCTIQGSLVRGRLLELYGYDHTIVADDLHIDLGQAAQAIKQFHALETLDYYYLADLIMDPAYESDEDVRFSVIRNLPMICLHAHGVLPDAILYYPQALAGVPVGKQRRTAECRRELAPFVAQGYKFIRGTNFLCRIEE